MTTLYNPLISYQENLNAGPSPDYRLSEPVERTGEPHSTVFGQQVYLPFGVPAGPLPNAAFCQATFNCGYDVCVYKTVRTGTHLCHPAPNVVPVSLAGDLPVQQPPIELTTDSQYGTPLSITNSFGVPSFEPDVWQPDMQRAIASAGHGQVLMASFQGTNRGQGEAAFIEDHVLGARLIHETGVVATELNLSCPNEGTSALLCYDIDRVVTIADKVKHALGDTALILKLGYFTDQTQLERLIRETSSIVDGYAAINTLQAQVRTPDGEQALPGEGRLVSGICGDGIRWAGLEMVQRLAQLRQEYDASYAIIGVGGVTAPGHYRLYRNAGADVVMSATGAMWHPDLALRIAQSL